MGNMHGKLVVDSLNTEDKLKEFIKMWRRHFLQTMNPQFLP